MNLKSCESCGVVLDLDQLQAKIDAIAAKAFDYGGESRPDYVTYDTNRSCYTVIIKCPVCDADFETGEEA